jgi:opacity protein-like surface antigen
MIRSTIGLGLHRVGPADVFVFLLSFSLLFFFCFFGLPAFADEHGKRKGPDYARTGLYVGAGLTYATDLYEDEIEDQVGFSVDIDDTFGANARLGARFLRFVGFEVQYEWLDTYDIKIQNAGGKAKVDTQTLTANLKLYLPLSRFQPYALGGIGYQRYELDGSFFNGTIQFKQDEYAVAGRLGVGFDLYITEHVVFFAEGSAVLSDAKIEIPTLSDVDQLFYAGIETGLIWRF